MGDWVKVKASDGHELSAYVARPNGQELGGIVIVQEIFGVNKSIRAVADSYAQDGFVAIAPAIMDRIEPNLDLGYSEADLKKAFSLYPKLNPDDSVKDVAAAFKHISGDKKDTAKGTAVLGFCYGGLTSWLSATRLKKLGSDPACTVCYYPGGIGKFASEEPSCPVMIHFGGADDHIGKDQIDAVRNAHGQHQGEVQIFVYEGVGHAFANPDRPSFDAEAAKLARERSLSFLKTHIA
jgi:carboxymethylenebutenolidase